MGLLMCLRPADLVAAMPLIKYRPTPLGWAFLAGVAGIIAAVVIALSGGSDSKASPGTAPAVAGSPTTDTRLALGDGPSRTTPANGSTPGASATASTAAAAPGDGAIAIANPAPPPDPGFTFAFPLQSWLSIGDRYGAPRGTGYIHGGIDLNVEPAAATTLYSVCNGTFVGAGQNSNYGSYFVIDCGNQWTAVYAMVASTTLRVQDAVTAGEAVGVIGPATGAGAVHLHFELRYHGYPMNPETYMQFGATAGVLPIPTPTPTDVPSTATATATKTPLPAPHATATPAPAGGTGDTPPAATDTPVSPPTATPTPSEPTPTATATPPPTETVAPTRTPLPPRRSPTPAPVSD